MKLAPLDLLSDSFGTDTLENPPHILAESTAIAIGMNRSKYCHGKEIMIDFKDGLDESLSRRVVF